MQHTLNPLRRQSIALAVSTFAVVSTPADVFAQTADNSGLEEVTITAQRREETLQKSSLAIEVLGAAALEKANITQATDIGATVPGVQVSMGGAQPQVYIRGVGDYGATAVSNPAIALNVDGVYTARTQSIAGTFFDLQRMELLKGPQGTLYGRNASGGAINLLPVQPQLHEVSGYVEVGLQNYSGTAAEAAINVPIGETLAMRVSAQAVHRDGYLSDGTGDDIHQSGRVQLLWKPNEQFDARLWASYSHSGGKGNGNVLYDPSGNPDPKDGAGNPVPPAARAPLPSFDPWTSITDGRANQLVAGFNAAFAAQNNLPPGSYLDSFDASKPYQDLDFYNFHAEVNWHMDWATLTVIPAYQTAKMAYLTYPGLSYETTDLQGTPETSYASSLEARLSNNTDQLKWVVGGYYFDESQNTRARINNGFLQRLMILGSLSTQSYAAFGQATYAITDPLRVIAGLRYTRETKDAAYQRFAMALSDQGGGNVCFTSTPCFLDERAPDQPGVTYSATNFRTGLEYDVADQSMLFLTVASGFKAGLIPQAAVAEVKPEKLMTYTVGSRNRFFDSSLQLNLEGFYYNYKDHQEFVVGTDDSGRTGAFQLNAGDATAYGGNLDLVWAATRHDQLRVAAEYLHATYDSFTYKTPTALVAPGSRGCHVDSVDVGADLVARSTYNCSGKPLIRAPKWTGLASYTHTFDLSNGSNVDVGADMSYASERYLTIDFIPNSLAPSYVLWNANVSYNMADGKIGITAFVHNISNEAVYSGGGQSSFAAGLMAGIIGPPRTYGVRLKAKF